MTPSGISSHARFSKIIIILAVAGSIILPAALGISSLAITAVLTLPKAGGKFVGSFGIARDSAERQRAEASCKRKSPNIACGAKCAALAAVRRRRNQEPERFNRAMVGRELEMVKLKRQVNELKRELGREPPFSLGFLNENEWGLS